MHILKAILAYSLQYNYIIKFNFLFLLVLKTPSVENET